MREYVWTNIAKECYKNGCMCSRCDIVPKDIKPTCQLKKTVIKLVEQIGRPDLTKEERRRLRKVQATITEIEILKLLPLENDEMAKRLVISPHTVRTHVHNLLTKFEAKTKTELLAKVLFDKIINIDEVMKCLN